MSNKRPYRSARKITPGTPAVPGRGVLISTSSEGKLTLVMDDGSLLETYVYPGITLLDDIIVRDVNAAGTTATATVSVVE